MQPMYSHFNEQHWFKVKAERARLGIVRKTAKGEDVHDHPLAGKTVIDKTTGQRYVVERVKKDWWQGWFLTGLLSENGSHRVCPMENISSTSTNIVLETALFAKNFRLQH